MEEEELDDGVETSEDDAALDATDDAPSSSGGEEADAGDEGSYAARWRYARAPARHPSSSSTALGCEAACSRVFKQALREAMCFNVMQSLPMADYAAANGNLYS